MTTFAIGFQIDFKLAIVFNSPLSSLSYSYHYSIQNYVLIDDPNYESQNNITSICFPNPCKNGGLCIATFNNTFHCNCFSIFTG